MGVDTLTFIKKEDLPKFIKEFGIEGLLKLRFYRWYSFCDYFGIEERDKVTSKELLKEMKIKTDLEKIAEEIESEAEEEENERKALAKLLAVKEIKEIAEEEKEELENFYKEVFEKFDIIFIPDSSEEVEELEKTHIEVYDAISEAENYLTTKSY
jgi:protein subunit release factor A